MRGSPALLGRGGVHRQAIRGLTMDASASCLARVCARLFHLRLRCSAQPDGEESQKPTPQQKRHFSTIVIPAKARIQGPKRCTPLPTPHPPTTTSGAGSGPLLQGGGNERQRSLGLRAGARTEVSESVRPPFLPAAAGKRSGPITSRLSPSTPSAPPACSPRGGPA